jgi:hypothetical protein
MRFDNRWRGPLAGVALLGGLALLAGGGWTLRHRRGAPTNGTRTTAPAPSPDEPHTASQGAMPTVSRVENADPIAVAAHDRAERLLQREDVSSEDARRRKANLLERLENPETRLFFDHTIDFLGGGPGSIQAAKFVALTISFDQSSALTELMADNLSQVKENSDAIMSSLEAGGQDLGINAYFHNRILNLVHQLDVDDGRKAAFYGRTLATELHLDSQGSLDDSSLAFEVALILAKQDEISSPQIESYIADAIESNSASRDAIDALKARVLTYYPDLEFLFSS